MSSSGPRDVLITGLGSLTGAGRGTGALWQQLVGPAAPVRTDPPAVDPAAWLEPKQVPRTDPVTLYALVAGTDAWRSAGLDAASPDPDRCATVGTLTYGPTTIVEEQQQVLREEGPAAVSAVIGLSGLETTPATSVAARLGVRGPCTTVAGACAGGAHALLTALDLLRAGRADVAVVVGTQGPVTPLLDAGFRRLRVRSPSGWCRPFDVRRDGFVPAPGAAAIVLETSRHATARGAVGLARLLGAANTNDAADAFQSTGPAAERCVRLALADAGLDPADVAQVSAHGTGTAVNDAHEARLLAAVFGEACPPVTAVKRSLGHTFGASGVFEAVAAVQSIGAGLIPPGGADWQPDPELRVPLVVDEAAPWEPGPVLSTSFGLGGHDGAVVIAPVG